ncbi:hypothetical protein [Mesorhizobium sp.]|uniref:hypothetical protein n=1 Tax=Mesorhizobium sp. TaxID=1871066 RepID=UPI0025B81C90|nr:hypothetical protein [Mesorhizobium sp.]
MILNATLASKRYGTLDETDQGITNLQEDGNIRAVHQAMHEMSVETQNRADRTIRSKAHEWWLRCPADRRPEEPPGFSPGPIE